MNPCPKQGPKPRKKRYGKDYIYIRWLRTQPCCNPNCLGKPSDIVSAHMRILGCGGTGIKPPDRQALPLCFWCHDCEHNGVITFWCQKTKQRTIEYVSRLCNEHIERYEKRRLKA